MKYTKGQDSQHCARLLNFASLSIQSHFLRSYLLLVLSVIMSSNSSQWPPYPTYMDCSKKQCSMYCPQWCYISPPPPRFDISNDDDQSSSLANDFSPLIIAVIGVLVTAFLLITYLTFMSKYCKNRRLDMHSVSPEFDEPNQRSFNSLHQGPSGIDEAIIKSIAVCKYKKGDGFVDGTECSVCLGEFEDDEKLRLLPKCSHAFHILCIDTWLMSHATCPLCRCTIAPVIVSPQFSQLTVSEVPNTEQEHTRQETVLVVQDLEAIVQQELEGAIRNTESQCIVELQCPRPMRRSVSLNSYTSQSQERISIANIHNKPHEGDHQEASSENVSNVNVDTKPKQFLIGDTEDLLLTRSVSTGRSMLAKWRHGHGVGNKGSSTFPS